MSEDNSSEYVPIILNSVFSREYTHMFGGSEPVTMNSVIIISRYDLPSEQEVVDRIQKINKSLLNNKPLPKGEESKRSSLENAIVELPDELKSRIYHRDRNMMDNIKKNLNLPPIEKGQIKNSYLNVRNGLIPLSVIVVS